MQIARDNFISSRLYFCPDMATFLYPLEYIYSQKTKYEEFFLLRKDIEKKDVNISLPKTAVQANFL